MSKCNLVRFENGIIVKYDCSEVLEQQSNWKSEFRKENGVDLSRHDKAYESFCREIDEFLMNCPHLLECEKCSKEECEGAFCKCEYRNMLLAKRLRKDQQPQKKDEDE